MLATIIRSYRGEAMQLRGEGISNAGSGNCRPADFRQSGRRHLAAICERRSCAVNPKRMAYAPHEVLR